MSEAEDFRELELERDQALYERDALLAAMEEITKQDAPHSYRAALLKCLEIANRAVRPYHE